MKGLIVLLCFGSAVIVGCATPHQYVYNCTPGTVTFEGKSIATRTLEPRSGSRAPAPTPNAIYPDGSVRAPLRVQSGAVDSFSLSNAWISPANVCRQFGPQVVIVDLR